MLKALAPFPDSSSPLDSPARHLRPRVRPSSPTRASMSLGLAPGIASNASSPADSPNFTDRPFATMSSRGRSPAYHPMYDFISEDQSSHPGPSNSLHQHDPISFNFTDGREPKKRPRRKSHEIERIYKCNSLNPPCSKAYGTLNHLNAHIVSQNHGPKRNPAEFKELRRQWKQQKQEQKTLLRTFRSTRPPYESENVGVAYAYSNASSDPVYHPDTAVESERTSGSTISPSSTNSSIHSALLFPSTHQADSPFDNGPSQRPQSRISIPSLPALHSESLSVPLKSSRPSSAVKMESYDFSDPMYSGGRSAGGPLSAPAELHRYGSSYGALHTSFGANNNDDRHTDPNFIPRRASTLAMMPTAKSFQPPRQHTLPVERMLPSSSSSGNHSWNGIFETSQLPFSTQEPRATFGNEPSLQLHSTAPHSISTPLNRSTYGVHDSLTTPMSGLETYATRQGNSSYDAAPRDGLSERGAYTMGKMESRRSMPDPYGQTSFQSDIAYNGRPHNQPTSSGSSLQAQQLHSSFSIGEGTTHTGMDGCLSHFPYEQQRLSIIGGNPFT